MVKSPPPKKKQRCQQQCQNHQSAMSKSSKCCGFKTTNFIDTATWN